MNQTSVIIQSPTVTYDAERNSIETWTAAATLRGYLLPESGELVQRLYGIDDTVTDRFIYKGQSDSLVVGNRLVTTDNTYLIVWVGNYGRMADVKLKRVVV